MKIESVRVGMIDTNCYFIVLNEDKEIIIVDPGDESQKIISIIKSNSWNPLAIFNTHGHYDHIGAVKQLLNEYDIPVYLDDRDLVLKKEMINSFGIDDFTTKNQQVISILTAHHFQIIATPGHSQGSVCLFNDRYFFSGDTIFSGGFLGRTDLFGGDHQALENSVKSIFSTINADLIVLPGHGPRSSISQEKAYHGS